MQHRCSLRRGAKNHSMSRRHKNVGVIGLGIIGSRVTETLRQKGFHVFVWNRTPQLVPNFVGAPAEIAEMCDFVQVFVSDDDALLQMAEDLVPALAPRHIVLAHSTVSPHSMQRAASIVESCGARLSKRRLPAARRPRKRASLSIMSRGTMPHYGRRARFW